MSTLDRLPAKGNLSSMPLRVFNPPPDEPRDPDKLKTVAFDAIPSAFHADIADRRMPASASMILGVMLWLAFLRKEKGYGDGKSCWATNKAVGVRTGLCDRQVRNVRRAIIASGWLRRDDQVGPSDPIDPKNRTGERWYFPWLETGQIPERQPMAPKPKRGRPKGGGNAFPPPLRAAKTLGKRPL